MYSDVVMEVGKKYFEELIDEMKAEKGVTAGRRAVPLRIWQVLADQFKAEYKAEDRRRLPRRSAKSSSWAPSRPCSAPGITPAPTSIAAMNDIPYCWGTAVNVQMMAFGNMGDTSGTGVAFTRDPATGEKKLFGEFLMNAQGEDVVAGVRTPQPIAKLARGHARGVRAVCGHLPHPGEPLPRHAGYGIHHRGQASCICCRPATASVPPQRL